MSHGFTLTAVEEDGDHGELSKHEVTLFTAYVTVFSASNHLPRRHGRVLCVGGAT